MAARKPKKKTVRPTKKKPLASKSNKTDKALVLYENYNRSDLPDVMSSKLENLTSYVQSLQRYPLLDRDTELAIAKKYFDEKDPEAARILILANLRLVVKIASDYARSGINLLDLIQEGNIGLMKGVQDYDPYRGVKFSSYASYWIKAYIRSFVLRNWSLVKMGTTKAQRTLFYRLQKEKNQLEAMGIDPETKLLAEKLNVREKDITEMSQRMSGRDVSLNAPLQYDDSSSEGLISMIQDNSANIDDQVAYEEIRSEFETRLESFERSLAGKELIIFRERMRSENPKTLQEIGNSYGITRERVRQIENRVMTKLKDFMKQNAKFRENIIDL